MTVSEFNDVITDADLITNTSTNTFSNKTLIAPTNVIAEKTTVSTGTTITPTGGSLKNLLLVTALVE